MSEKKNNDYEKPESKGMGGDELEDVSAGAGTDDLDCSAGNGAYGFCNTGEEAHGECGKGGGRGTPQQYCRDGADPVHKYCGAGTGPPW